MDKMVTEVGSCFRGVDFIEVGKHKPISVFVVKYFGEKISVVKNITDSLFG